MLKKYCFYVVYLIWAGTVSVGLGTLLNYSLTPAAASDIPSYWPQEAKTSPNSQLPTLVMFMHPQCPCTKATVRELSSLMTACQGKLEVRLFFLKPQDFSEVWVKSDLWRDAEKIPGVRLFMDANGEAARLFHAATSGQCLLYNPDGVLLFHGGITAARGHSGNNVGRQIITAIVNHKDVTSKETFVFGCALFNLNNPSKGIK